MATALDICTAALRRAGVVDKEEAVAGADAVVALGVLNRMMHAWKLRGVDVSHTDYETTSTFALDPEYQEATVFLLARELALEYERSVSPMVQEYADQAWRDMQASFVTITKARFDASLLRSHAKYTYGNSR